ncbi:PAS domain S-box-containing protein [Clostridium pascui]|uniref:PAS domain-containing sensor histidine kinase n=1 Tax=Clostridium pascui TaxID=46609 RepID=UPI00195B3913|nr:ATP-binding protein [Clostridium pascui]MBM7870852.1 PAS domain S-box-containing protein [Clostridium pascui]
MLKVQISKNKTHLNSSMPSNDDIIEVVSSNFLMDKFNASLLESLLTHTNVGITVIDENFNIVIWNNTMSKITGMHRRDVVNSSLFNVFPFLEKIPDIECFIQDKTINKYLPSESYDSTPLCSFCHKFINNQGSLRKVEIEFCPSQKKNEHWTLILVKDVTDKELLKELSEKIEKEDKLLKKLQEIDKMETEFFANISHELRTPINVILSATQLLTMDLYGQLSMHHDKKETYYNSIKQNSFRLIKIINNLIDITKLEAGYYKLSCSNYNIVSVVENITLSIASYVEDKSINLIFDTDVEEKIISCDPEKIERIVLNLISNALKFTNPGGCIMVTLKDLGDKVKLYVKDTGVGIPEDKLELIFERFSQVDRTLERNKDGSGIGLSLVKSLVELHGGEIDVKSTFGEGCEFIITLPAILTSEKVNMYENNLSDNLVERISIEFSDIYK